MASCALTDADDMVFDDEDNEDDDDDDDEDDEEDEKNEAVVLASDDDNTLMSGGGATHGSDGHQAGQTDFNTDKDGSSSNATQPAVISTGSLKLPPHMKRLTQVKLIGNVPPCDRQVKQNLK